MLNLLNYYLNPEFRAIRLLEKALKHHSNPLNSSTETTQFHNTIWLANFGLLTVAYKVLRSGCFTKQYQSIDVLAEFAIYSHFMEDVRAFEHAEVRAHLNHMFYSEFSRIFKNNLNSQEIDYHELIHSRLTYYGKLARAGISPQSAHSYLSRAIHITAQNKLIVDLDSAPFAFPDALNHTFLLKYLLEYDESRMILHKSAFDLVNW